MAVFKAFPPFFTTFAVGCLVLGGCAWMGEDDQYYLRKDWENFKDFDWLQASRTVSGVDEIYPSPAQRRENAEKQLCMHKNGENRVVTQNGVSDRAEYRRCVLEAYPVGRQAPGQRMGNRPDPS